MLSKPIQEALQDIFGQVRSNELHPEIMDDPEAYLLALLMRMEEGLHSDMKFRKTLFDTIEQGGYEDHLNDAKKKLGRPPKRTSKRRVKAA